MNPKTQPYECMPNSTFQNYTFIIVDTEVWHIFSHSGLCFSNSSWVTKVESERC